MEHPNRKPTRLRKYDYSQNGAYFVTVCTQDRKKILSHIVGDGFPVPHPHGMIAEEFIRQIPVKYPSVAVDKYVIMPDHIHLIIRFDIGNGTGNPSPTLGTVIGWYKYQVTKQINFSANTEGEKVFQRSYYDHVIRNQRDYDEIWQYIENNPMKRFASVEPSAATVHRTVAFRWFKSVIIHKKTPSGRMGFSYGAASQI